MEKDAPLPVPARPLAAVHDSHWRKPLAQQPFKRVGLAFELVELVPDLRQNGSKPPLEQQVRPVLQHEQLLQVHRQRPLRRAAADLPRAQGLLRQTVLQIPVSLPRVRTKKAVELHECREYAVHVECGLKRI